METLISTGDKDLTQLVEPDRTLVQHHEQRTPRPCRGGGQFGVPPGASSITWRWSATASMAFPASPKCGPKTALKWLAQYGDLDGIVAHADEIGGVVGKPPRPSGFFPALWAKAGHRRLRPADLPAPGRVGPQPRDADPKDLLPASNSRPG